MITDMCNTYIFDWLIQPILKKKKKGKKWLLLHLFIICLTGIYYIFMPALNVCRQLMKINVMKNYYKRIEVLNFITKS